MTTRDQAMPRGGTVDVFSIVPEGAMYDQLRFAIQVISEQFPDQLSEITPDRVQGWVDAINLGTRDDAEIRSDIFEFVVGTDEIMDNYDVTEAEAQDLISGTLTFAEIGDRAMRGVERVGETVIPEDATLIKVNNPDGSSAPALYYLVYEWQGVQYAYEVGDGDRLNELFGGEGKFDNKQTLNQTRFDNGGYVLAGSADPLLGADESFSSLMERETKAAGMEDLPDWIANSTEALAVISQGAALGWTSSRIWEELSGTDAFTERFGATIDLYRKTGGTIQDAVQQILADEDAIAQVVRRYGEPGASYDSTYFQSALSQGWDAQTAAQVLEAGNRLARNPTAMRDANAVLAASGLQPVDEVGMINLLLGGAPDDVTEAINTANADRALRDAGLTDVDTKLLMEIVDTTDRVLTVESFREVSQQLAFNVARYGNLELARNAYGVGRDEITAALFGEAPVDGKMTQGEVLNALAKIERDRRAQAQGTAGAVGFVNQRGDFVLQGLAGT